jgi:hypothetical protein
MLQKPNVKTECQRSAPDKSVKLLDKPLRSGAIQPRSKNCLIYNRVKMRIKLGKKFSHSKLYIEYQNQHKETLNLDATLEPNECALPRMFNWILA